MPKVHLENIHLSMPAPTHLPWSLRAHVVEWAQNPKSIFAKTPNFEILKGISLEFKSGERVAIIGRNGSGKTSLCRVISGGLAPTSGKLHIDAPVTSVYNTTSGIHPDLTGRENGRLLLHYLLPHHRKHHHEFLEEALDFSGLKEWSDRPFRLYSAGMKSRLTLSLITKLRGEILILDEVFDGADEEFRNKMKSRIRELIDRSKIFIFVSHTREQVNQVCERALVMDHGELKFDGKPAEAFRFYDHLVGKA